MDEQRTKPFPFPMISCRESCNPFWPLPLAIVRLTQNGGRPA